MKKKTFSAVVCTAVAASIALMSMTACGDETKDYTYNPETRPFVMSTLDPDGVFNPFFSSSTVDSNVVSMTQIGMLNTNKNGEITFGDDEPCVVKDYSIVTSGSGDSQKTTYQFVIKNGIKFSDGVDLTIKDVLFNLYVYLDPAFTGSATIYSTDIVGLNAYRLQDENATDATASSFEERMTQTANMRITDLVNYAYYVSKYTLPANKPSLGSDFDETRAQKDFVTLTKLFRQELETDWNTVAASMETYKEASGFTHTWQVFLINDGGYNFYEESASGIPVKNPDNNNNYTFDPDKYDTLQAQAALEEYLEENGITAEEGSTEWEAAVQEWAIGTVYSDKFGDTIEDTYGSSVEEVAYYWATASTLLSQFTAEAKTDYFSQYGSDLPVPTISGITAVKGSAFKASSESVSKSYGNEYDVLQIVINGIDPKAIYNFGFTVAPLHYYSSSDYNGKDYINGFNADTGNFGLPFSDSTFMTDVINASSKVGVPVGAGVYKGSTSDGRDAVEAGASSIYDRSTNYVYFQRNEYFETVGSGLSNAKIKYVRYKVVASDQIVNSLNTGEIDYGEPNATQEIINMLNSDKIAYETALTNGYGYVGINARFVQDINVRRAIIKAMDTSIIKNNYYKSYSEYIYRSMSKASWAYPEEAGVYTAEDGTSYLYDSTGTEIQKLINSVQSKGYYLQNGVYTNGSDTLDYKFTIAGGSTDHPAYAMFLNAAKILNACTGIKVTVVTSQTALSDLTTGKLEVWAAAWTSTVDPDMYQVYHKDSTASSTKNWGYDYIKADKEKYKTEWNIISDLSILIDEARETNDQAQRKAIYADALDLVMELAVEFPTYQRNDLFAYNKNVLDSKSLTQKNDLSPYNGLLSHMWEIDYN